MKTILVTGGMGYIGSHTVVELYNAGYRAVIVDNLSNSKESALAGIEAITKQRPAFYKADYTDTKKLEEIIVKESIDGVIHFAALKAVGESVEQPLKYYENNVGGFIDLLKTLEANGVPVVFSSSCAVYGEADSNPVSEEAPLKPAESPYGATKQMCETILRDASAASSSLKGIALRYFNVVGAHPSSLIGEQPLDTPSGLFPRITGAIAGTNPGLTVYGDDYDTPYGSCIRDFIHVVDLAKAHIKALQYLNEQPAGFFDVFNIGTGTGSSVLEVVEVFEKVIGKPVPHHIGPRRAGDIVVSYADASKANKRLGWKAEKSLEDACLDAWKWQEKLTPS